MYNSLLIWIDLLCIWWSSSHTPVQTGTWFGLALGPQNPRGTIQIERWIRRPIQSCPAATTQNIHGRWPHLLVLLYKNTELILEIWICILPQNFTSVTVTCKLQSITGYTQLWSSDLYFYCKFIGSNYWLSVSFITKSISIGPEWNVSVDLQEHSRLVSCSSTSSILARHALTVFSLTTILSHASSNYSLRLLYSVCM